VGAALSGAAGGLLLQPAAKTNAAVRARLRKVAGDMDGVLDALEEE
jgi:DNA-binding FrmR family transcriptional regulator